MVPLREEFWQRFPYAVGGHVADMIPLNKLLNNLHIIRVAIARAGRIGR